MATAPTRACFTSLGLRDPGGQAGSGGLLSYPSRACRPNGHPASSWILLFSGYSEETRERLVAMGTGTVGQLGTPEPPSSSAASRFGPCCLSCPPPGVLSTRRGPSATAGHRRCWRGRTPGPGHCPCRGRSASQGCSGVRVSPNPKLGIRIGRGLRSKLPLKG